jgi:hypothetical protein
MEKKKTYQNPTMEVSQFRFTENIAYTSGSAICPTRGLACSYWKGSCTYEGSTPGARMTKQCIFD